uniref:nitrilase-related carbon-nitrogen hydrolase n=1 Tax=Cupriavidus gilardii TaxID=82541 RepID=UPI002478B931|nr:nitrilase-related carbon-nitrogen hydrolase [Cupriavidus gilardii]
MPLSTGIFFAETAPAWLGWALWMGMAIANALPWAIAWRPGARGKAVGLVIALLLTTVPPLGILGWANPLTAAGAVFPGLGFIGLAMIVAAWIAMALKRHRLVVAIALFALACNTVQLFREAPIAVGWTGLDTHYGRLATGTDNVISAFSRLLDVKEIAADIPDGRTVVLPETVLGHYTKATARNLAETSAQLKARGSTLLVGAEAVQPDGSIRNILLAIGATEGALQQRVPVPIGMWHPWSEGSVSMNVLDRGVHTVGHRRVAPLICYEQLLVFPVLVSMAGGADTIVAVANLWWARETSAPAIQRQTTSSWARLFGVPVVHATNF